MKRSDASGKGYSPAEALDEAKRCLQCTEPYCNEGCPAGIDVRGFIREIVTGNLTASARYIREKNILGLVCGYACPVEKQCEEECCRSKLNYPITIARLQRFVCEQDYAHDLYKPEKRPPTGKRVAVVGSGPAGLSAAAELTLLGHEVVVFEKHEKAGGVLSYAVPLERLPQKVVDQEVESVRKLGAEFRAGASAPSVDDLTAQGFDAVFIGVGLGRSAMVGMPGEDLEGVYTALDFLEALRSAPEGQEPPITFGPRALVIGGGDVAMDVARSSLRRGAQKVEMACLEAPNEMPATMVEIEGAWEEGVIFHYRFMPSEILGENGRVTGCRGVQIEWKEPDKFIPSNAVPIPGSELRIATDTVVEAIGQRPGEDVAALFQGLKTERGRLVVDEETFQTSREGVFAAGDIIVRGGPTVVRAVAQAKEAAQAMDQYLSGY